MIAQVALSLERTGLPYLVFAVDDSASMGIVDRYDDPQLNSLAEREVRGARVRQDDAIEPGQSRCYLADDGELLREAAAPAQAAAVFRLGCGPRRVWMSLAELLDRVRAARARPAKARAWARACVAF